MKTQTETYFGDENSFGIRYQPAYYHKTKDYFFAHCHLVFGGQIIGDKEEYSLVGTWTLFLKHKLEILKNSFYSIGHEEFLNRTDKEIFEIIWKSNQLEDEFKAEYLHLPILDDNIWKNCSISIDETTDAFLITMTKQDEFVKFLWEGWREPCEKEKVNVLYSVIVNRDFVVATIENFLVKVQQDWDTFKFEE